MAENPLVTLARVLGGVVLMQGDLGHQVLGQLLILNTNEVAMAAAAAVIAGTTGQRSAAGQIALRTVAPALAVRMLLNKQEQRVEQRMLRLADRERALIKGRIALRRKHRKLDDEMARLAEKLGSLEGVGGPPVAPPAPAPLVPAAPAAAAPPSPSAPPARAGPVAPASAVPAAPLPAPPATPSPAPLAARPRAARTAPRGRKRAPSASKAPAKRKPRPGRRTKKR